MGKNIEVDDQSLRKAMRGIGTRTKKATVEAGLHKLTSLHEQAMMRKLHGG